MGADQALPACFVGTPDSHSNNSEEPIMKKAHCFVYLLVSLVPFVALCQPKVDVEKEKDAIQAVLEEEKKGYFERNFEKIASTWLQKPSSVKMFMGEKGEMELFGWTKISESDKEGISKDRSEYKNMDVKYSDFHYHIYERSAWTVFKARWDWIFGDKPGKLEQTRIMAFEKVEGKWKITLMAIYNVPTEKQEAQQKGEKIPK
jgi:hypothetical protein